MQPSGDAAFSHHAVTSLPIAPPIWTRTGGRLQALSKMMAQFVVFRKDLSC
jgi:hypothetical protein